MINCFQQMGPVSLLSFSANPRTYHFIIVCHSIEWLSKLENYSKASTAGHKEKQSSKTAEVTSVRWRFRMTHLPCLGGRPIMFGKLPSQKGIPPSLAAFGTQAKGPT